MNLKVNISVDDYTNIENIQDQIIHEAAVQRTVITNENIKSVPVRNL